MEKHRELQNSADAGNLSNVDAPARGNKRTHNARSGCAPIRPRGRRIPVAARGGRHSAIASGGTTLIAKHAAVVGLCILALAVPAIPGIEGLAPGEGSSVTTSDGSAAFLSAPACSETRTDLCLSSAAGPPAALVVPSQFERRESRQPAPEAEQSASSEPVSTPEPTPEPEPWGAFEIRPGDTLIALSDWFGVSPFEIAVLNGAAVDDYLVIGHTLLIPVPESLFVVPPVPDIFEPADAPAAVAPQPQPAPEAPPVVVAPPASSGQTWTPEEVVEAICSFPWPCEKMVAIASCESGLRPDAVNPIGYYGIFQIDYVFEGWDNPWTNAYVAYYNKYLPMLEWSGDGLSPWPVCRYY